MDLNGSGGDARGPSLDDLAQYIALQRYLAKTGGLFGGVISYGLPQLGDRDQLTPGAGPSISDAEPSWSGPTSYLVPQLSDRGQVTAPAPNPDVLGRQLSSA